MFIVNKYSTWYFNIITCATASNRSRRDGYFERHHIVPKSLGGSNDKDNLVLLTAREHYICHLLLCRMLEGDARSKMIFACTKLAGGCWYLPAGVVRSRTFDQIKKLAAAESSKRLLGVPKSNQHKENLRKSFALSAAHKTACRQNATLAHKANLGKCKPDHSKFMKEFNASIHSDQFIWKNEKAGIIFEGSRIDLQKLYPDLRLDELWKVSKGKARSHKGWIMCSTRS